jgi:hypothetical protein
MWLARFLLVVGRGRRGGGMWRRGACGHRRRGHRTGPGPGRLVGGGCRLLGLPLYIAPSSATSTSCTPCCFLCRPFPPTSTAKHIKNIPLARQPGHCSLAFASKMSRPTAGFSFGCLCVCNCSFSLLLVLATENLFDLISFTNDG